MLTTIDHCSVILPQEPLSPSCPAARSPWTPDQLEALCLSAEHWLENYQDPANGNATCESCACCTLARDSHGTIQCPTCPIGYTTSLWDCGGTPWLEASTAIARAKQGLHYSLAIIAAEYAFILSVLFQESNPS